MSFLLSQVLCVAILLGICLNIYLLDHMFSLITIILFMFYLPFIMVNSLGNFLLYSKIQNPYYRQFVPSGFVASIKPPVFEGVNYKRWCARAVLWFQTMSFYNIIYGTPDEDLNTAKEEAFQKLDT